MRCIKEEVHVVFITQIGREDGCVEVGGTLIAIVASGIRVVEVEAYVEALVGIDGKLGIDVILAVGLITTVVVEDVGIGREGVHEEELLRPFLHKAVGLRKDEDIIDDRTIDEDSAQARCVVVTRSVVLAIGTCVEGGVHEEVRHRVRHCWDHIAKLLIDGPHIDTLGNHLVLRRVVSLLCLLKFWLRCDTLPISSIWLNVSWALTDVSANSATKNRLSLLVIVSFDHSQS